ncbi:hypothetical protein CONLIGDRAFT_630143 [Coniochaeta ligniaria NRRL 30616]|uniref:Uncharacterized protein n=1 Tax=Coniochaeta ligniaria NRRL 30616 TaxID=1408157 RepID=A0A1J7IZ68_9PEZI|nr:hypothetical protein CONLIGDRAFT_630143 [Coniochaeta ligniaria NRRL 30616]
MTEKTLASAKRVVVSPLAPLDPYKGYDPSTLALEMALGPLRLNDGNLNPRYIAVAAHGYQIQSTVLHIPDRFGCFSPGPPPLQAWQGFYASMIFGLFPLVVLGAVVLFLAWAAYSDGEKIVLPKGFLTGVMALFLALGWIFLLLTRRLSPDYKWGTGKTEAVPLELEKRGSSRVFRFIVGVIGDFVIAPLIVKFIGDYF